MPRQTLITPQQSSFTSTISGKTSQQPVSQSGMPNTRVSGYRLVAWVLDWLLLSFVQSILFPHQGGYPIDIGIGGQTFQTVIQHQFNWPWVFVLFFAYYFLCETLFGATPGKLLLGLRVVTVNGQRPSLWQTFVRSATRVLEVAPGLFEGAWFIVTLVILFTPRNQRIGDLLAGTVVASASSVSSSQQTRLQRIRRGAFALAVVEFVVVLCLGLTFFVQPYHFAYNWQRGEHPDFLPPDAVVQSSTYPITQGRNATGEPTVTYVIYFTRPADFYDYSGSDEPSFVGGEYGTHYYKATITYHWDGILSGWEFDRNSTVIEEQNIIYPQENVQAP